MGVTANAYFDGNLATTGVSPGTQTGINPGAPPAGRWGQYHTAGAPVNGAAGSFFGVAPKYSLLIRDDTGVFHMNTGTLASPTWTIITGTP
jgi:hypothetical protein